MSHNLGYKVDGWTHSFRTMLGDAVQGDVENRYDAPVNRTKQVQYASYEDLYPNFVLENDPEIQMRYVKQNRFLPVPPISLFKRFGLKVGEYKMK